MFKAKTIIKKLYATIIILVMVAVCAACTNARAINIHGYVFDASMDEQTGFLGIGCENGIGCWVSPADYPNIDVDDSVDVIIEKNQVVSVTKANADYLDECKNAEWDIEIDMLPWASVTARVTAFNAAYKELTLVDENGEMWACESDYKPTGELWVAFKINDPEDKYDDEILEVFDITNGVRVF